MFLIRRPSAADIDRFLDRSRGLSLSYSRPGIVSNVPEGYTRDESVITIGRGQDSFERACAALRVWRQFDVGWVEVFADRPTVEVGTNIAVLIRHLGFWSLNGGPVLYRADGTEAGPSFGFAYGTLTNHAESGEELFEVLMDPRSGAVQYRIRAVSRPRAVLARLGYPVTRALQARFRRDSCAAMARATRSSVGSVAR